MGSLRLVMPLAGRRGGVPPRPTAFRGAGRLTGDRTQARWERLGLVSAVAVSCQSAGSIFVAASNRSPPASLVSPVARTCLAISAARSSGWLAAQSPVIL